MGGKERLDCVREREKDDGAHAPLVFGCGHFRTGGGGGCFARAFGEVFGGFLRKFRRGKSGARKRFRGDKVGGTVGERGRKRLEDGLDAVVLQCRHPEQTRSGVFDARRPIENRTDLAREDQARRGAHDRAARFDVAGERLGFGVREGKERRSFARGRDGAFKRFVFGVCEEKAGAREKTFHGLSAQIGAKRVDRRREAHGKKESLGVAEKRYEARLGRGRCVARIGGGRFRLGERLLAAGVFLGDGAQDVLDAVANFAEVPAKALAEVLRLRKRHVFRKERQKVVGVVFKKGIGDGVQKAFRFRASGERSHGVFGGKR